jgi:hypothetical protein
LLLEEIVTDGTGNDGLPVLLHEHVPKIVEIKVE